MQDLQVSSSYTSELPGDAETQNMLRQARCFTACIGQLVLASLDHIQRQAGCSLLSPGAAELSAVHLVQVHKAFWSPVSPTSTSTEPYLVAYSQEMAEELGLDPAEVTKPHFAEVFTGNAPIPGSQTPTYAMRYGGHQFGSWAGMQFTHLPTLAVSLPAWTSLMLTSCCTCL